MAIDDTRHRILNAAGEVFAEKGYGSATIREICRLAEANLASVNYYFGDKERLYVEVLRAAHPGGPEAVLENEWPEGLSPEAKLKVFIRSLLERLLRMDATAWKMQLLQREILNPTPFCREMVQEYFRARFVQLMDILGEVLPSKMSPHRRHQIGFSIIGQCVYFQAARNVIKMVVGDKEQAAYYSPELLTEHVYGLIAPSLGLSSCESEPSAVRPPHGGREMKIGKPEQDQVES